MLYLVSLAHGVLPRIHHFSREFLCKTAARTPQLSGPCAEAPYPTLQFKMAAEWAVRRHTAPGAATALQALRPFTADEIRLCSPARASWEGRGLERHELPPLPSLMAEHSAPAQPHSVGSSDPGGTWGRRASNNRRSCSYLIFSPHSSRKSLPISLTALVTAAFCFSTFTKRAHSFLHLPFQLSFHFPSLFKSLPRVSARPTDSHPGLPTAGETRWCRQASPLNSVSPSLLHSVAPVSAQFMPLGSVFHEQSLFSLWTQFGIWCLVSQVLI